MIEATVLPSHPLLDGLPGDAATLIHTERDEAAERVLALVEAALPHELCQALDEAQDRAVRELGEEGTWYDLCRALDNWSRAAVLTAYSLGVQSGADRRSRLDADPEPNGKGLSHEGEVTVGEGE